MSAHKDEVIRWETVAGAVVTYPSDGEDGACDARIQVGRTGDGVWYVRTRDAGYGPDDADDTAYATRDEAVAAAVELAADLHEGDPGEDAEDYLARRDEEAEALGEETVDGPFALVWLSANDAPRVEARYDTREHAEAALRIATAALARQYPGGGGTSLLCGYEIREES